MDLIFRFIVILIAVVVFVIVAATESEIVGLHNILHLHRTIESNVSSHSQNRRYRWFIHLCDNHIFFAVRLDNIITARKMHNLDDEYQSKDEKRKSLFDDVVVIVSLKWKSQFFFTILSEVMNTNIGRYNQIHPFIYIQTSCRYRCCRVCNFMSGLFFDLFFFLSYRCRAAGVLEMSIRL